MSATPQTTAKKAPPAYRLCFSAKTGTDRNGQPTLSYPVEIGAAFHRKDAGKGLIAKFTIIPTELSEGVLFLMPPGERGDGQPDLLDTDTAGAGQ